MKIRLLFFIIFLGLKILFAQVAVQAYVNTNRIAVGGTFMLTIEAKGENIGNFPTPQLPEMPFALLGTSKSNSTSMRLVNGKMTTEKAEQIVYRLRADTAGDFRIPTIAVTVGNQNFQTRPISINVAQAANQNQQNQTQQNQQQQQRQQNQITTDGSETFILADVDKRNVYRNEMIIVHFKLYTQSQVQNISFAGEPSFSGFWKEDLYQADRVQWAREVYEGRQYNTFVLRSIALFPSREGSLTIPSLDINVDIVVPARSFWEFNSSRSVRVSSRQINIQVNPLPAIEANKNFIGAVGRFDVTSSLSEHEGSVGNSLTYRIELSGTGNFNQTLTPNLPDVQGLRILPPETNDAKTQSRTSFLGKRTFIYPIILQESGNITIPEIEITWFDPANRSYQSKTLKSENIIVNRSEQQVISTASAQQTIRVIGKDIEFIDLSPSPKNYHYLYQNYLFWILFLLLPFSLLAHYYFILEKQKIDSDLLYKRNRRANAVIRKYLREANHFAKQDSIDFYSSAHTGLSHFITDKLNLPRGSLEKDIIDTLKEKNISEELVTDLQKSYEKINFIKFSRSDNSTVNIKEDEILITKLILDLMNELNKKTTRGRS